MPSLLALQGVGKGGKKRLGVVVVSLLLSLSLSCPLLSPLPSAE